MIKIDGFALAVPTKINASMERPTAALMINCKLHQVCRFQKVKGRLSRWSRLRSNSFNNVMVFRVEHVPTARSSSFVLMSVVFVQVKGVLTPV